VNLADWMQNRQIRDGQPLPVDEMMCRAVAENGAAERRLWPIMRLFACAAAAIALHACVPGQSQAPPLEPGDFLLRGVPLDADSAEIRLSFGDPDSVVVRQNPYDALEPIESWHYDGLVVHYSGDVVPSSFLITGGDEATLRGIRVGDSADDVLRMYGQPPYRHDAIWTYVDPLDFEGVYVIEFMIEDDRVTRIHLGRGDV
jgi:hypothetical protein